LRWRSDGSAAAPRDKRYDGLKGSDDVLEGTLADMLTVLNGKAIDHGWLLFNLAVNSPGPPNIASTLGGVRLT
jgi:hypothetical protein